MKQVRYFYEGETEKKLLEFLKNSGKIKPGKLKKHNLWKQVFKLERTIDRKDAIFFVIDTDDTINKLIFIKNINKLKPYNICLIVQHKNLEDELCYTCRKNTKALFRDFYSTKSKADFKSKFAQEKNLSRKLNDNNFNFNNLWSRNNEFVNFLGKNSIVVNIDCKIKL